MPGDNLELRVKLEKAVALEPRMDFTMREGGRTVGAGRVVDVAP